MVEAGEQCDDGNAINNDACKNTCTNNVCGDGVVSSGMEACDDGNSDNSDGCLNDCTVNPDTTGAITSPGGVLTPENPENTGGPDTVSGGAASGGCSLMTDESLNVSGAGLMLFALAVLSLYGVRLSKP